MFVLDFKPTFYTYPLTPQQFTRIKHRQKQILSEIHSHQQEIQSTLASPKYSPLHIASTHNFSQYRERLHQKISILKQELHEYRQIVDCHQEIDEDLKKNKKEKSEIKHKILDVYKHAMIMKGKNKALSQPKQFYRGEEESSFGDKGIYASKVDKLPGRDRVGLKSFGSQALGSNQAFSLFKKNSSLMNPTQNKLNPEKYGSFKGKTKAHHFKLPSLRLQNRAQSYKDEAELEISRHKINDPSVFSPKEVERKKNREGKVVNFGLF